MRKLGSLLTALALVLAFLTPGLKVEAATSFSDVSEDFWASEEINRFAELGIINGYEDGKFHPNDQITRAQAAVILVGGLELDTANLPAIDYSDVDKDNYAYDAIAAVTNEEIMVGYKGNFQPNEPLTRAEMSVILTKVYGFEGSQEAAFKDVASNHYAYEYINALYANEVTVGYPDNTFKPNQSTTRAEYIVLLAKAIDNGKENNGQEDEQTVTDLLKEAYANELAIEAYEFEGDMNFGVRLPESLFTTPEDAAIAEMLSNIEVTIDGAYQTDPMAMEATVDVTLTGDIQTTISIPMVMTAEKMWMKLPQTPMAPLPEELDGKFIEFDLQELAELEGQPSASLDLDLQTEFALAVNNLFLDHFGKDFYNVVGMETVDVPVDIDAKQAFKFEVTNESLQPFFETLMQGFLPEFLELLSEDAELAQALGIPAEEIELIQQELPTINENLDIIVSEINNVLAINTLELYSVINQDNFIAYTQADMDLDFTVEEETFGFKLYYDEARSNINGDVTITLPNGDNVISFEELIEIEEELLEEAEVTEDTVEVETEN